MPTLPASALTAGLIVGGALVWASLARPLTGNPALVTPVNPLGINRSPYGEVIAMAMQGPIDFYFHGGAEASDHECDADCDHEHAPTKAPAAPAAALPLRARLTHFLSGLDKAVTARTNPKPASPALKFYLRRQTEDRLRFAYNLDPAHYGNFACYYFFLTQPELGTRPELTPSAVKLAQETIDYCLQRNDDPRPALTAAAAAENILEQLIVDRRSGARQVPMAQLQQTLALIDHCLARHQELSAQWEATGNWELLSSYRRDEVRDRLHFLNGVRKADAVAIQNLSNQVSN
jgi:hypothetical protein